MIWKIAIKVWLTTALIGGLLTWGFICYELRGPGNEIGGVILGYGSIFSLPVIPLVAVGLIFMLRTCATDQARIWFMLMWCCFIYLAVLSVFESTFEGIILQPSIFLLTLGYALVGILSTGYFSRKLIFQGARGEADDPHSHLSRQGSYQQIWIVAFKVWLASNLLSGPIAYYYATSWHFWDWGWALQIFFNMFSSLPVMFVVALALYIMLRIRMSDAARILLALGVCTLIYSVSLVWHQIPNFYSFSQLQTRDFIYWGSRVILAFACMLYFGRGIVLHDWYFTKNAKWESHEE